MSGTVRLDGNDVLSMSRSEVRAIRWSQASIVFQGAMHSLDPVIRVADQITEAMQAHDPGRGEGGSDRSGSYWNRSGYLLEG